MKEYVDVFPKELPYGTPLHEIQHAINFILGAIPQLLANRMSPKEHEEL